MQNPTLDEGPLSPVDLFAFSDLFVAMAARESQENENVARADRRYPVQHEIRLGLVNDLTGEFVGQQLGWALNISVSGIFFFSEAPIEPKTIMAMSLAVLGIPGCYVRLRIMRCDNVLTETYRVGATFLHD